MERTYVEVYSTFLKGYLLLDNAIEVTVDGQVNIDCKYFYDEELLLVKSVIERYMCTEITDSTMMRMEVEINRMLQHYERIGGKRKIYERKAIEE